MLLPLGVIDHPKLVSETTGCVRGTASRLVTTGSITISISHTYQYFRLNSDTSLQAFIDITSMTLRVGIIHGSGDIRELKTSL